MSTIKMISGCPYIPYSTKHIGPDEMLVKSEAYFQYLNQRRSIREFSEQPVAAEVVEALVKTASTSPSGANKQPWTFCLVGNTDIKKQIRMAAEQEEMESYAGRMPEEWLKDLAPLGTGWEKPFLEKAPWLIVVFKRSYEIEENGHKHPNYYVTESCGIACGLLLAAIFHAGLSALTHTPSPMNFLADVLKRPANEKPFLLIPVGYAADECWVPDIKRKIPAEIINWY